MTIDASRDGGSAVVRLEGRLDREWSEHLSRTVDELLQDGVRTLVVDMAGLTYVSSAAVRVLARCQEELAVLRGEVRVQSVPGELQEMFALAGWDSRFERGSAAHSAADALRQSSWYSRSGTATGGEYQMSSCAPEGALSCRMYGRPDQLTRAPVESDDCHPVGFPAEAFGLGLGAIGRSYDDCRPRIGELIAVAGSIACFPTDGARMADYLSAAGRGTLPAVLVSGLVCEGGFSKMVRFTPRLEAQAVPLSELVSVSLEAAGGEIAGLVIAGETAGLSGARLRRSPAGGEPVRFELPGVRDWLSFAPERTYPTATALIAGVVARQPSGPLAAHLRRLGPSRNLFGHLHAAVFSYCPVPQRTVELADLVSSLFEGHELRDVLHLVWDDRGLTSVGESALIRGVGWVGAVTSSS
jgi:anti-anti-sigma factor